MAFQPPQTTTTTPGVNQDSTKGFFRGCILVDTVANVAYVCISAAVGAALWTAIGSFSLAVVPSNVLTGPDVQTYAAGTGWFT